MRLARDAESTECPAFRARRDQRAESSALPMVLSHGEGLNLFDVDGNRYVDLAAGFGAAIFGHGPTPIHARASEQIGSLVQGLGDMLPTAIKIELSTRLAAIHPDPHAKVLLGQSGADAVTAALKTACLATDRPGVLAFEGAYHGLSYAPLAACGFQSSLRLPFHAQLNPHVNFAPYPSSKEDLSNALSIAASRLERGDIGAVLIEPVLGRGGVLVPPTGFLRSLFELARKHGALVIADEIWTGMGRAGAVSQTLAEDLVPDLLCFGKGLGASFPISACIGTEPAMDAWARSGQVVHTSTHAGAPLGCAAALAVLDALEDGTVFNHVRSVSARFFARAKDLGLTARGKGFMLGLDVPPSHAGPALFRSLINRGYLTTLGGSAASVIVLTPPLTTSFGALESLLEVFRELVDR